MRVMVDVMFLIVYSVLVFYKLVVWGNEEVEGISLFMLCKFMIGDMCFCCVFEVFCKWFKGFY